MHKTAQRTLFLLFAYNNCFSTLEEKLLALFEFRRFFLEPKGGGTRLCAVLLLYAVSQVFFKVGGFLKLHPDTLKYNYSDAANIGEVPLRVI
jgi:hypothetical protein